MKSLHLFGIVALSALAFSVAYGEEQATSDAFLATAACMTPSPGLAAWWRAEGTANDSASGNHGALFNGATFAAGKVGQAFSLDGVDDYVEIPNAPTLNPTTAITVEAWYKPTVSFAGNGNNTIVDKGYLSHSPPYYQYHLGVGGDRYFENAAAFSFSVATGGNFSYALSPAHIWTLGNWYHLVGTYDGTSVKLYVNGALVASSPASGTMTDYGKNVRIGSFSNLSDFTPGLIDEVSIYNRALATNEVAAIHAAGSSGKCPPMPFAPGDLMVVRVGDGSAGLGANAAATFLDEYTPAGAFVQSIALPTAVNGSNRRLTLVGNAPSEGQIQRSANGLFLTILGYNAPVGMGSPNLSSASSVNRVVAVINGNGAVDTTTAVSAGTSGNVRSAVSDDGTHLWVSSSGGGVGYVNFGAASSAIQLSSSPLNVRNVDIFFDQLFVSSATLTFQGVSLIGSGLPTTAGQTTDLIPGFPISAGPSPYGFFIADLDQNIDGPLTIWVADDRTTGAGGVQRWTFNGSTVNLSYTLSTASGTGARGLTVDLSGPNPIIYVTTTDNKLKSIIDTGAGATAVTLASAAPNTVFRGLDFAPRLLECPAVSPGTEIVVYPGDPHWGAFVPNSGFARPTAVNPRCSSGSLEISGVSTAFLSEPSSTFGTYGNLSIWGFDWFTDPTNAHRVPPDIALRVYPYSDSRTFFLQWSPGVSAVPAGVWQRADVMGHFGIQQAEGHTPPASLAAIPADAPIVGIHIRGGYNFGDPWHGFVDNFTLGFRGGITNTYNFEIVVCPNPIVVTTTSDSGPGSLRQAILDANDCPGTNIIQFAPSAYGTIRLTSGELLINDHLIINGPGANNLAVDGNHASRVFHTRSNTVVSISGLTITNGYTTDRAFPPNSGGGVLNDRATLTISNCVLSRNSGVGGAIFNYGGTGGTATVQIVNSTLSGNIGYSTGGGIQNDGGSAVAQIVNSALSGNSATFYGGGIINSGGASLRIVNSTLSGNSAWFGGGIYNVRGTAKIANSTFSANSASVRGGGIDNISDSFGNAGLEIVNSTFVGNSAIIGYGIFISSSASLQIGSTILSNSAFGPNIVNEGTLTSLGYNLSSDAGVRNQSSGTGDLNAIGDQINTDPKLGPLQDNGGPTFTHAFTCRSPAVDAGKNFSGLTTDQRGFARTFDGFVVPNADGGDGTDIGAVEAQQPLPRCNQPPVADASATITLAISPNGSNATVVLDGSRSSDPDGDFLQFSWYESVAGGSTLADGVVVTTALPVGTHTILLVVNDGTLSDTNGVTIEVITASEAVNRLAARLSSEVSRTQPLIATLNAAIASFDRSNPTSGINELEAFQNKVKAQVEPLDAALAAALIQAAQEVIDILNGKTAPSDINRGLVAYYPLDGNLRDASGFGNDGTTHTGNVTYQAGKSGRAAWFDGQTCVRLPQPRLLDGASNATLSAWIWFANFNGGQIAGAGDGRAGDDPISTRINPFNAEDLQFEQVAPGDEATIGFNGDSLPGFSIGAWHLFTMVLERQTSQSLARCYVDTSLVKETSSAQFSRIAYDTDMPALIGAIEVNSPGQFWIGGIDELRFYDRALSGTEVALLYGSAKGNPHPTNGPPAHSSHSHFWTIYSGEWNVIDKKLSIEAIGEDGWIWAGAPPMTTSGDLQAQLKVEFAGRPPDDVGRHGGIMFFASVPTARYDFAMNGYPIDWIDRSFDHGLRLHRWDNGSETILAEVAHDLVDPPTLWQLEVQGDLIRFFADGQLIFEVADGTYRQGHFGLWAYPNGTHMLFDDAQIGNFRDSFNNPILTHSKPPKQPRQHLPAFWTTYSGQWEVTNGELSPLANGGESWIWAGAPPIVTQGDLDTQLKVEFTTIPQDGIGRHGGIMFFASEPTARGSASGYTIDWIDRDFDHGFRLHRWDFGSETILVETGRELADPLPSWHVQVQGDVIRFFADGQLIFDFADNTYRQGHFGVWDYGNGGQIRVDHVRIGDIFHDSFTGRSTLSVRNAPHAQGFELSVSGPVGATYRLQAADDLGSANWTDLFSFTLKEGTTNLLDPAAPSFQRRFYRVVSP